MHLIEEQKCPYCSVLLPKVPARKTKCKSCGNYYFVKTRFADRRKVIVTQEERKQIEAEWQEHFIQTTPRPPELSGLVTEEEWEQEKKKLLAQGFFINDVTWSLLNKKLLVEMKRGNFQGMKSIYYTQAIFLQREGRDYFRTLQESVKCELREFQRIGYKKVAISTAGLGNSCEKCQEQDGKVFTIEESLRYMPIPVKDCSTEVFVDGKGFCRCSYVVPDVIEARNEKPGPEKAPVKEFECPYCNQPLTADNVMSGTCPSCKKVVDLLSVRKTTKETL